MYSGNQYVGNVRSSRALPARSGRRGFSVPVGGPVPWLARVLASYRNARAVRHLDDRLLADAGLPPHADPLDPFLYERRQEPF